MPSPQSGPDTGGTQVSLPLPEVSIEEFTGGGTHSVALSSSGQILTWGKNHEGQLGIGTLETSLIPVAVPLPDGITGFTDVSAGNFHTAAIATNGTVYTWGGNGDGQLGNNSPTPNPTPTAVPFPDGVTAFTSIETGNFHTVALGNNGRAYSWGENEDGQLGNGVTTSSPLPVAVTLPEGVTSFTSIGAGTSHTVAIGNNGVSYAWGSNDNSQLGIDDDDLEASTVPLAVSLPEGVASFSMIGAGNLYSVAIANDGTAYSWGFGGAGRLGNGSNNNQNLPGAILLPEGTTHYKEISAGNNFVLAIGNDNKTYSWGNNANGRLGNGNTTNSNVPVGVILPTGVSSFTSVAAANTHSLAIGNDSNAYAWGGGEDGRLGNGTTDPNVLPTQVLFSNVVEVTNVTFDGISGTAQATHDEGTLSVTTPAHPAGPVDVLVYWEIDGVEQEPILYQDGFTYFATDRAPAITDPANQTVTVDDDVVFTVTATGHPGPTVGWQVSADQGATWAALMPNPSVSISADGQTLTLVGKITDSGNMYRAIAANGVGEDAISDAATLTVTAADPGVTPGNGTPIPPGSGKLESTGGSDSSTPIIVFSVVGLLLISGAGMLIWRKFARGRSEDSHNV